jgi:phosphate transport system permease protein
MSSLLTPAENPVRRARLARLRLNAFDRRANRVLIGFCVAGALLVFFTMVGIAYQVIKGAMPSIQRFGIGFVFHASWVPNHYVFGAWTFVYGTLVTGVFSLVAATVLGVSIGIFLSMIAPRPVAAVVGPMIEMLAAIPSVVLGFIGIIIIAPFAQSTLEPIFHDVLGFIPLFGAVGATGYSIFTASLVLTIMVVPIISALTRDVFLTVPRELTDGAEALGSTRWEVVRGVVLPTTTSGILAACVLGFGRAIGEAIAVSQVIGNLVAAPGNLFQAGNSLASSLALQFPNPDNDLHTASLYYLAVILFVFGLLTNLAANRISARFRARMS